jgi:hypothetical protein
VLVIFGFRVRGSTVGSGTFFCPSCGGDRPYVHKKARRWFTIFFVPLIPLKEVGEYVECQRCKTTYKPSVLSLPTTSGLQTMLVSATREALTWLLRTSESASGTGTALEVLTQTAGSPWRPADLETDLAGLDVAPLPEHLRQLAGMLNEHGREHFLANCVRVAAADGVVDEKERHVLDQMALSLGLSPAHSRGIIDATVEQSRPRLD